MSLMGQTNNIFTCNIRYPIVYSGGKTPQAFMMHCIPLRISLKFPSAVYFSAITNICPHTARALFRPAQVTRILSHIQRTTG